jgi:hypothetical protein
MHAINLSNNKLHDMTTITLAVARFVGTGCFFGYRESLWVQGVSSGRVCLFGYTVLFWVQSVSLDTECFWVQGVSLGT